MSLRLKIAFSFAFAFVIAVLAGGSLSQAAAAPSPAAGISPALCGPGDAKEPGLQGDVPAGLTQWQYNCGVRLVGQLPLVGNVQGVGTCAYVRTRDSMVHVIDVSDPAKPKEVKSVPVKYASETMRVVVNKERAILVSGSSVYDIRDCLNPVLMGEIKWPPLAVGVSPPAGGGGGAGMLPHDLRVNHAGTKVYGAYGLWEVDITNLKDPESWKVSDLRCEILSQLPGPWQEMHRWAIKAGRSLCVDAADPNGANYRLAASGTQTLMLWPTLGHSPDVSGDDRTVYLADQAPYGATAWQPGPMMRIVDVSQRPAKLLGQVAGPGHGLDWFRAGGRDYVVHSNERGSTVLPAPGGVKLPAGDPCKPYPRPTSLGWAFEAIVSDVTNPARARNVAMLQIAINNPENCAARKASGRDPWIAYHLVDNVYDAHFAAVNFGSAGLRIYDIRPPTKPYEVAYFNHGPLVHAGVGYYDAARGLIYAPGSSGFWVLEVEPQVRARLGI